MPINEFKSKIFSDLVAFLRQGIPLLFKRLNYIVLFEHVYLLKYTHLMLTSLLSDIISDRKFTLFLNT